MNRAFTVVPAISGACIRRFGTSEVKQAAININKIKQKQVAFQVDDGVPVYLKGGFKDKLFYYSTIVLVLGTFGFTFVKLYEQANKK